MHLIGTYIVKELQINHYRVYSYFSFPIQNLAYYLLPSASKLKLVMFSPEDVFYLIASEIICGSNIHY